MNAVPRGGFETTAFGPEVPDPLLWRRFIDQIESNEWVVGWVGE